ncbi:MAG: hypothetical protein IT378_06030 [Sandaracinaceae bacterium]|nr:hypothetical protein [Sandaracinaceae bacterium]
MSEASDDRRARVTAVLALVLALLTPAALLYAWSRPLPVEPRELPPLVLSAADVAACLERDAADARRAPDDELAHERRRLYHAVNVAEHEESDAPDEAVRRHDQLMSALDALVSAHGTAAVAQARAGDVARLEPALRGELPAGDRLAELGAFVPVLERYGAVEDGRQRAPSFVVRALFWARWNAMHERPLDEGFCPPARIAYEGWLALRAERAPLPARLAALDRYAAAGGPHADEARGVLLFAAGDREGAREALGRALDREPSFRLRNHNLACDAEPGEAGAAEHLDSGERPQ